MNEDASRPATTFFMLEQRWLPDADGALTKLVPVADVPRAVSGGSTCEFDWSRDSAGAHELALNLLEIALTTMEHEGPRSIMLDGACFTLALLLRGKFVADVLSPMPADGARIDLHHITAWIDREIAALPSHDRSMIAPRYWIEDRPGEHWSYGEISTILGCDLTSAPDGIYAGSRRVAVPADPNPLNAASWETHPI